MNSSRVEGVSVTLAGTPVSSKVGSEPAGSVLIVAGGVEVVVTGSDVGCGTVVDVVVVDEVVVEEVVLVVVVGSDIAGAGLRDGVIAAAQNAPTMPRQDHLTKARRSRRWITHDTCDHAECPLAVTFTLCQDRRVSEQSSAPRSVDRLVARTLAAFPFRFTVAEDDDERLVAYRLRQAAVIERGWNPPNGPAVDAEEDAYDNRAVHVIGWHDDTPVSTGRIVLPPGLLPTEEACALRIEPRGRVVDVGRMVVAPSRTRSARRAFVALMARLYLEVRKQGFTVACGMMAPDVRHLVRQLGVQLDVLGPDRPYWGDLRGPVRFDVDAGADRITQRWAGPPEPEPR